MIGILKRNKFLWFMTLWMIPSSTFVYVIFHDFWKIDIVPAYIAANIITGIIFYAILEGKVK